MTSSAPGNASHDLRGLLGRHHDRLDKIFGDLVTAFDIGEREEAARLWNGFEAELAAHFELEEKRIFPELACAAPAEAAALECEHDRIRASVAELGVGLDLHLTRADAVAKLMLELKAHADREESLLYRWADLSLDHELRAAIHAHGTTLPRKSEPPRAPSSPRLVVYIEDNPSSIALMKDLLADFEDVEMISAPTAEIGIEIVRARLPAVVIMDIHLPGMSGFEATQRLREWPETREIPVIALSAAASLKDSARIGSSGFYRYLEKPMQVEELVQTLERLLNPRSGSMPPPVSPAGPTSAGGS